ILVTAALILLASTFCLGGILIVNPNEAKVLTVFGRYLASIKEPGIWFANPFAIKRKLLLRIMNFESTELKVNDNHSNPIEIGSWVVWQVVDSAEALFEVDDYENFVRVQSEAALRALASSYPYDAHQANEQSLSGSPAEVSKNLQVHVQDRLSKAGVEVLE